VPGCPTPLVSARRKAELLEAIRQPRELLQGQERWLFEEVETLADLPLVVVGLDGEQASVLEGLEGPRVGGTGACPCLSSGRR
jgi:hypothetical protein